MHLYLAFGPMFSGKSTWLIKHHSLHSDNSLIINHALDFERHSTKRIITHDGKMSNSDSELLTSLGSLNTEKLKSIKNIFINEGQFFNDLHDWLCGIQNLDINVWVSGLDYDYNQKPFGQILACIPLADDITRLTSMCSKCNSPARYTKRISNNNEQILIGGNNIYTPCCRLCYFENNLN